MYMYTHHGKYANIIRSCAKIYIYIFILIIKVRGILRNQFFKGCKGRCSSEKINCTTGIRTRDPSLVIRGALPTELWCSCQPRQNRKTLSLEHQTHSSFESTQAGGTQPSIYIYIYLKKLTIEANLYSTINKIKVAGFFIPKTHMAFRLILFSELTSGK